MERRIQRPLTLPKHRELLNEVNQKMIDIKLTHLVTPLQKASLEAAGRKIENPTWDEMVDLLCRCYQAINEQREDPRKY